MGQPVMGMPRCVWAIACAMSAPASENRHVRGGVSSSAAVSTAVGGQKNEIPLDGKRSANPTRHPT